MVVLRCSNRRQKRTRVRLVFILRETISVVARHRCKRMPPFQIVHGEHFGMRVEYRVLPRQASIQIVAEPKGSACSNRVGTKCVHG